MIRLAISCDICGTEKKQTNHWFVAYEHSGELRISGWSSRLTKRAGSRHLCGQTCLHKLVDEFMAQTIAGDRATAAAEQDAAEAQVAAPVAARPAIPMETRPMDASLTSRATYAAQNAVAHPAPYVDECGDEFESSARLIPAPEPPTHRAQEIPVRPVAVPARAESAPAAQYEAGRYASHQWRSAAWERERARERSSEEMPLRRKSY